MLEKNKLAVYKRARIRGYMLLLSLLFLQVTAIAQTANIRITIQNSKITVVDALKEVEKQSKMSVGFNDSQLKDKPLISLNLINQSLEESLTTILKNTGFTYQLKGNYILIVPQQQTKERVKTVSGRVVDEEGVPLIGVNIQIEGKKAGVITNFDGEFFIEVPIESTLTFSYVGYTQQMVKVGEQNNYHIQMYPDAKQLSELVVTALGIKREQKALSYNVQELKNNQLTEIKDANFINSLNGKVAGVTINSSSSGVGGASKVVMRGVKSIEKSNNALYVIDGIPMFNFGGGGDTEFGSRGATESIADLNPEDIESISVLTGAAASALYGSNAANGAIVITTKKGVAGKLQATVSTGIDWLNPFVLPKFQNRYGTGSNNKPGGSSVWSWGPKMEDSPGYKPTDFFETGAVYNNAITLSAGSDKNQTFFSAAAVNSDGMVPNNRYNRYNFTFRNTTNFLNDKMKLDVSASYIIQNDRNMTNQGQYSNPLVSAYLFPRGDDFSLTKIFERYDESRKIFVQYWPQGEGDLRMQNPYWIAYRNLHENSKKRYMLSAGLNYDVLDWLNLSGRIRIDNSNNTYEQKLYASTINTLTNSENGFYEIEKSETTQTYADFLVNINKRWNNWNLVANIGTSLSSNTYDALGYNGPISEKGIPNVFNVFDLDHAKKRPIQKGWEEMTQSIFASVEVGWKSMLYLTLTGRNDWASQLKGSTQPSFFYPSVGLSAIISEMAQLPGWLDYLKVRGSFSSVGTPYPRHLTIPTYKYDANIASWIPKTHFPIGKLYPERTDSWEVGLDATLFKDLRLSASFYYSNTYDQTFDPKISASFGYSKFYVQTGYVRNLGIEGILSYGHLWRDFGWNSSFTFSSNKNEIIELVRNFHHPETGSLLNIPELEMNGLGYSRFRLKEGGTLGDLYSHADLIYNDKGYIEVDDNGSLAKDANIKPIKLGSVLPKANLSWNNDFSYKGINAGFLLTCRIGGIVYSATQAALDQYGVSEASAIARDEGIIINGRTNIQPQKWFETIGSASGLPQYYTYSATNLRLQEAHIGYTIPRRLLGNICDINISLVGRNLWMIYCKAPFDPESVATTNNYYQGIDYFMMPSTRNLGFNVKINF